MQNIDGIQLGSISLSWGPVGIILADLPSLKLTFSPLKMDGWNTKTFPFGAFRLIFRCELLVLGRVVQR